jgi:hypothetical protein
MSMQHRYRPIHTMTHKRSYAVLGQRSQARITSALLRTLGFESTTMPAEIEGLSGLRHRVPLLAVDSTSKRLVVVQGGAEEISRFFHEQTSRYPTPRQPKPKAPEELALEWLEKSLFRSFDLREAIRNQGWTCNVLYFFNSFETPTAAMTDEAQAEWLTAMRMPSDAHGLSLGAEVPISSLDVDFLRSRVISAGAAFIDANQLEPSEVGLLAGPWSEGLTPLAQSVVTRVRLRQFFSPPLDELILGTLTKAGSLPLDQVELAPILAERSGHPIAPNTIARESAAGNVMDTLRQLESMRQVTFRRREAFVEPDGRAVVQEWERTAQESLFVKILREIRVPELLQALIRGIRGGDA